MSLGCPQCGAPAPSGTPVGTVYACPRCRNPVLPREAHDDAPASDALAADGGAPPCAPAGAPHAHRSPWPLVLLAIVVLAAAHGGLWALLTAEGRRDRAALLAMHGDAVLRATDPGAPPPAEDAAAWRDYRPKSERWRDRVRCEQIASKDDSLALGLGLSFAAQAAILLWVALKWSRRVRERAPPPAPAGPPSREPESPASPAP